MTALVSKKECPHVLLLQASSSSFEKSVVVPSFMVCIEQTLIVSISNEPPCCVCVFFLEREEEVCEYFNNFCIIWRKRVVSIMVMRKEKGDKDIPSLRSWTGWGCDAM